MTQNRSSAAPRSTSPAQTRRAGQDVLASHAPWLIRGHYAGTTNLDEEMTSRFPAMPVMSSIHFRHNNSIATLATQDGAAVVSLQADPESLEVVYTLSSMLGLRFHLDGLTASDRSYWLDLLRAGEMPLTFLWGQRRWDADYLVWAPHRYFVNLYAFSPRRTEAAARLTIDVVQKLLDWLQYAWTPAQEKPTASPSLDW